MFENLTLPHLLMVLVIAMLLFGAKRIPEIAGSMGKGIREFKKNVNDVTNDALHSAPARAEPPQLGTTREAMGGTHAQPYAEPRRLI